MGIERFENLLGLTSEFPVPFRARTKDETLFLEERQRGFVFIDFFPMFECHYDNSLTMWFLYCKHFDWPVILLSLRRHGSHPAIQGTFLDIFVRGRRSLALREIAEKHDWVTLFPSDWDASDMTHFYPQGRDLYRPYSPDEEEELQSDFGVGWRLCEDLVALFKEQ